MANTTNYNWETPDDTDLVKDGAAAIRTLGSSADTTLKNLNPQTTTGALAYRSATANVNTALPLGTAGQVLRVNSGATAPEWATTADQTPLTTKGDLFGFDTADARIPVGTNNHTLIADSSAATGLSYAAGSKATLTTTGDILYASSANTPARLGIGTSGQVLTVSEGVPSWATASGGSGLTLITNQALSASTININNCFSSTYENYVVVINITNMSLGANIRYRLRVSGSDSTTDYKQQSIYTYQQQLGYGEFGPTDYWQFGNADPTQCFGVTEIGRPFATDRTFAISHWITGLSGTYDDMLLEFHGAIHKSLTSYTGLTIYTHNGATITGNARIYGKANS